MTPEQKTRFLQMEEMRKKSVADVLIQPRSSQDVLTDKQRKRTIEVSEMLSKGENPFEKISTMTLGGGEFDKVAPPEKEVPESVIKSLEDKWRAKNNPAPQEFLLDDVDMGDPIVQRDPTKSYCSFCGKVVEESQITRGKGKVSVSKIVTVQQVHDHAEIVEKTVFKQEKVKACPDCSLNIKQTILPPMEG